MGLLKLIGCDTETRLREIREEEKQRQGFLRRKAAREKEWNEEHGISEAAAAYAAPAAGSGNGRAVQNALMNMFSTSDLDQMTRYSRTARPRPRRRSTAQPTWSRPTTWSCGR